MSVHDLKYKIGTSLVTLCIGNVGVIFQQNLVLQHAPLTSWYRTNYIYRLRRVKMEKRILADQGNSLVDLCKVREASERIVPSCSLKVQASASLQLTCYDGFSLRNPNGYRCRAWCTTCCQRCRAAGGNWTHTSTPWRSMWRSWGRASRAWCRCYPARCPRRTPPSATSSGSGRWRQIQLQGALTGRAAWLMGSR